MAIFGPEYRVWYFPRTKFRLTLCVNFAEWRTNEAIKHQRMPQKRYVFGDFSILRVWNVFSVSTLSYQDWNFLSFSNGSVNITPDWNIPALGIEIFFSKSNPFSACYLKQVFDCICGCHDWTERAVEMRFKIEVKTLILFVENVKIIWRLSTEVVRWAGLTIPRVCKASGMAAWRSRGIEVGQKRTPVNSLERQGFQDTSSRM
jgi:hypothetical protein